MLKILTSWKNCTKDSRRMQSHESMRISRSYWERRGEWAICFRDQTLLRGNNTNNYAESGIRILKDIVFKRVKAYNLVQLFGFMTVTFELYYEHRLLELYYEHRLLELYYEHRLLELYYEHRLLELYYEHRLLELYYEHRLLELYYEHRLLELYYEHRLLAVAHNRMDRYIAVQFKGLGASKVNLSEIRESDSEGVYIVKSQSHDGVEYGVDTSRCHCTCIIAWTGKPTGEPCKGENGYT